MKKVIGRHTFLLAEIFTLKMGVNHAVKPFDLMTYFGKMPITKDGKINTGAMLENFSELQILFDPLIRSIIIEGPDLGELTYGEYFQLIEPAIGALSASFKGLPEQKKV